MAAFYLGTIPIAAGDPIGARWDRFGQALSDTLGCDVVVDHANDYLGLIDALASGRVALGWVSPFAAAGAVCDGTLRPLVLAERGGKTGYVAGLVGRKGGPFTTVDDVRRAKVAWVDRNSAAGYRVIRDHLMGEGRDLGRMFSVELFCGSHRGVVQAVLEGRADVGATFVTRGGQPAELATLVEVGPIPSDFLCAGPALDGDRFELLQRQLCSGGGPLVEAARALLGADRFVAPAPGHLGVLERLRLVGRDPDDA